MRRATIVLAVLFAAFGTIPLVSRRIPAGGDVIAFGRVAVAAMALTAWSLVRPRPGPPLFSQRAWRLAGSGVALAVHWATQFAAYQRAPAVTVSLVVYLAPVGVAALAPWVLGERRSRATIGALAVALAGFVLVAGPALGHTGRGTPSTIDGVAFAVVSAVALVAVTLLAKPLASIYGGQRLARAHMIVAGAALAPLAAMADWDMGAAGFGWLAVLGIAHTAVGGAVYLACLARVPATSASILGYLEPVSVAVLAWLVLDEGLTVVTIGGGALVCGAGWLVVRSAPDDVSATHSEVSVGTVPG